MDHKPSGAEGFPAATALGGFLPEDVLRLGLHGAAPLQDACSAGLTAHVPPPLPRTLGIFWEDYEAEQGDTLRGGFSTLLQHSPRPNSLPLGAQSHPGPMGESGSALVSILDTETHFCTPKWASPRPALRQEPLMCAGLTSSSDIAVTPFPSGQTVRLGVGSLAQLPLLASPRVHRLLQTPVVIGGRRWVCPRPKAGSLCPQECPALGSLLRPHPVLMVANKDGKCDHGHLLPVLRERKSQRKQHVRGAGAGCPGLPTGTGLPQPLVQLAARLSPEEKGTQHSA